MMGQTELEKQKYWEDKEKRTKEFEMWKQGIISRTSALNNAVSFLQIMGVTNFTFKEILLTSNRLCKYIETGEFDPDKLDKYIQEKNH